MSRTDGRTVVEGVRKMTPSEAFVETLPAPPEVGPLLARLAGRFRLGILSNWPVARAIDRFVEAAGWSPHLAAIVVSQRVGTIKPDPAIYRYLLDTFNLRGEDTVFIDDTPVNLPPAQACGIKTIRFENAAQCERELRALGCLD